MTQSATLEVAEVLARLTVAEEQARAVEDSGTADGLELLSGSSGSSVGGLWRLTRTGRDVPRGGEPCICALHRSHAVEEPDRRHRGEGHRGGVLASSLAKRAPGYLSLGFPGAAPFRAAHGQRARWVGIAKVGRAV